MQEWYKEWFSSKEYLNVYSHRDIKDAKALINLILSQITLSPNSKILDSACGNGRHSELLSEEGFSVFGFDLSKTLLKIGQTEKLKSKSNVNYFCADFRKIPINFKFDLILNLFTSFGYFEDDAENFAIVEFASRNIKPYGFFVLDFLNPNYVIKNLLPSSTKWIADKEITETRTINNNRVEKKILIKGDGFSNRYFESVRLYSYQEILTLFNLFGFKLLKSFGNYSGERYSEMKSERMLLIFQK